MTQEIVDRLLDPIQTNLFTMEPPVLLFSGAIQDPQGDLEKHSIVKAASKAENLRKPTPRASKKNSKNRPSNHQKTIFARTWFLQYLLYENLVFRAPTVNNSTQESMQKVTWKQAPKKQSI